MSRYRFRLVPFRFPCSGVFQTPRKRRNFRKWVFRLSRIIGSHVSEAPEKAERTWPLCDLLEKTRCTISSGDVAFTRKVPG